MTSFFARDMTWKQVRDAVEAQALALLPIGSTEAHGPHLPLSVDVVIAEEVCRRVALRREAAGKRTVIFPGLAYSLTDFAGAFAGTVSLRAEVAQPLVEATLLGIAGHGFKTVAAVNHHLEPAHFRLVHAAAAAAGSQTRSRLLVPDHRKPPFGDRLGHEFMHGGSHAGNYETSLMLAAAPAAVREAIRLALPTLEVDLPALIRKGAKDFAQAGGPDAYLGAPSEATALEGERLFGILVEVVETIVGPD